MRAAGLDVLDGTAVFQVGRDCQLGGRLAAREARSAAAVRGPAGLRRLINVAGPDPDQQMLG